MQSAEAVRALEGLETLDRFVVGWGTLALINAGLAQSKGRSGLAWFLLSLLGGPLATLLIVLMSRAGPDAKS
jgi:hypothetical protein